MHKKNAWICAAMALVSATTVVDGQATNTFPSSGNVGIGTTGPANPFVVYNATYASGFGVQPGCDNANKVCVTGNNGGNRYFVIDDANKALQFWTNDSQAVTINSAGNVGIGTPSPQYTLDINGEFRAQGASSVVSGNGGYIPAGVSFVDTSYTDSTHVNQWSIWKGNTWMQGLGFMRYSAANRCQAGGICNLDLMLYDDGDVAVGENNALTAKQSGNVGIGTTSPGAALEVNGSVKLTANSGASITFQDGTTQSTAYTGVICGGDYADSVDVSGEKKQYEPGDVLVLTADGKGDVAKSAEPYSTLVAGIYSTRPGTVGRRQTTDPKTATREIPMAMVGIVPTKVSAENGPIGRGDLLVTASLQGYAMKGTDRSRMLGAVVGKAMGSLNSGTGVIEVLVTLQ